MGSNLVSNALESHAQVFPVLTEAQINRIRPFASLRHVNDGDVLFRADDSDAPYKTKIVNLEGDTHLERVTWRDKDNLESTTQSIRHVFIMTGASPRTEWLRGCVSLDDKGFILTGRDLDAVKQDGAWPLARSPYMLETSLPRVFAVGDVRSGNVKRVASAVGEGSIAIHLVHRALAEY